MAFGFFKDLFERFSGKPVDWDELEEALIRSDIGVPMTLQIIEFLMSATAGRLHTKHNLMRELGKIVRTLQKHDPHAPHECLLVVDATTGSNALVQAKEFREAVGLSGLVVTKLDGSGRGGIV